jgi:hypothetical protein
MKQGVPGASIIGDFASWDSVANLWFARLAVTALTAMRPLPREPIPVRVFISDFHAERIRAIAEVRRREGVVMTKMI